MSTDTPMTTHSYLSFRIGEEPFAANVENILEILQVTKITKVPKSPAYLRGVLNLRGSVLPVIDTRIKFDMPPTTDTVDTCIVVLQIRMDQDVLMLGALVDAVQEVIEIQREHIQPAPSIGSKYKPEIIEGMAKINDQFMMILDLDRVFSAEELITMQQSSIETLI